MVLDIDVATTSDRATRFPHGTGERTVGFEKTEGIVAIDLLPPRCYEMVSYLRAYAEISKTKSKGEKGGKKKKRREGKRKKKLGPINYRQIYLD